MNDSYWKRVEFERKMEIKSRTCSRCGKVVESKKDLISWDLWRNCELQKSVRFCHECNESVNMLKLFEEA